MSWTHVSIGRILENPNYLGNEYYPQIIEKELFDRVQKRREGVRAELGRATTDREKMRESCLVVLCGVGNAELCVPVSRSGINMVQM